MSLKPGNLCGGLIDYLGTLSDSRVSFFVCQGFPLGLFQGGAFVSRLDDLAGWLVGMGILRRKIGS